MMISMEDGHVASAIAGLASLLPESFKDWAIFLTILELHRQYGDVVRIAPNELSFATASAWKDIYNTTGSGTFIKSTFYKVANFEASDIIGESDINEHARMRRLWAFGFSAKALIAHEELEQRYVDLLINQIQKFGSSPQGMNVVDWFNYLTFDIIGELVFGESFGATEKGTSAFWISVILGNMQAGAIIDVLRRFGMVLGFKKVFELLPFEKIKDMNRHTQVTREMAASIAGSETTATTLSAATYFILKHPEVYAKMRDEIRSRFKDYSEITSSSVGQLPYFHAVLNETMRLYPPVPFGPPRISPGAYVDGHYIPKKVGAVTEVSVHAWTTNRDARYFSDPTRFDPERWLDPNMDDKSAFFPFLLGPRVCLGRNLAFIELRLVLAKVHFMFDCELVNDDVDLERESLNYILWQKPDINVRFVPRQT
ncbi:cytochrome P450 monooxygenase [Aspergillus luchuensis]|uniref:Cytochrome P450 monooxygenase n=1 Tax=Aspergillus kawachii TaxID=1069201 RepID=A0A146FF87_ASPKA|nr:cytochrome P450 monooxygenase [Aspergillus luchuensis]